MSNSGSGGGINNNNNSNSNSSLSNTPNTTGVPTSSTSNTNTPSKLGNNFTRINRTNNSADSLLTQHHHQQQQQQLHHHHHQHHHHILGSHLQYHSGSASATNLINLSSPPRTSKHLHAPLSSDPHSTIFNEVLTPIPVVRSINNSSSSLFSNNDSDPLDFLDYTSNNNNNNNTNKYPNFNITVTPTSNNFNFNQQQQQQQPQPLKQSTDSLSPPSYNLGNNQQQVQQQQQPYYNNPQTPPPTIVVPKSPVTRSPRPASAPFPQAPFIFNNQPQQPSPLSNYLNNNNSSINSSSGSIGGINSIVNELQNSNSSVGSNNSNSSNNKTPQSQSPSSSVTKPITIEDNSNNSNNSQQLSYSPSFYPPTFVSRPHSNTLSQYPSSTGIGINNNNNNNNISISPSKKSPLSTPSTSPPITSSSPSTGINNSSEITGQQQLNTSIGIHRPPPNRPPPPPPVSRATLTNSNSINSSSGGSSINTSIPQPPPPPPPLTTKKDRDHSRGSNSSSGSNNSSSDIGLNQESSSWLGMSLKFFKKRFTSGIGDKEPKWDLRKSNSQVLKVEDKQSVSYLLNHNGPRGIARTNIPFSSSFSYFELFITNGTGNICFGLSSAEQSNDIFPGFVEGSFGFYGDGKLYTGKPEGKTYGPSYISGDVVGCGYDSSTKSLYFTKNGVYLGVAAKKVNVSGLFPTVGLQSAGESVLINFSPPFLYRGQTTEKHKGDPTPQQTSLIEDLIPKEELETCRWDKNRCSKALTVNDRSASMPLDNSMPIGVVQTNHPFKESFCYFEIYIQSLEKGHLSIGLASKEYPLNLHIGWVKRSYGYHSDDGRKFKWKEQPTTGVNEGEPYSAGFKKGDTIGCGLFFETREIFFTKNGVYGGVAFGNVYGILYPSVAFSEPGSSVIATFAPPFKFSQVAVMMKGISPNPNNNNNNNNENTSSPNSSSGSIGTIVHSGGIERPINNSNSSNINNSSGNIISSSNGSSGFLLPSIPSSIGLTNTSGNAIPNQINSSGHSTNSSGDFVNTNNLSSKSLPTLDSSQINVQSSQQSTQPLKTSPTHSLTLPPQSISSVSSLSSFSSSGSLSSSSSSIPIAGTTTTTTTNNSSTNSSGGMINNSRRCESLPANSNTTTTNLTTSLASLSFTSMSPPGSPKSSPRGERKILTSDDDLSFVHTYQDSDGQPPSAWRRYGKTLKTNNDITVTMVKKKTAVAQANRPFPLSSTICYFEVYIEGFDKKGSITVGLTHPSCAFNKHIGREPKTYGYSSEGDKYGGTEIPEPYGPTFASGTEYTVIGCGINNTTREIFFTRNGQYLGVAFWKVPPGAYLYPSISMKSQVGCIIVATFKAPFKFSFDSLPGISPSYWNESLGPDRGHNLGLKNWQANDVAVWLEVIGYGQYRKKFRDHNISGRHLTTVNHEQLKNDLGVEPLGHRADILNRIAKMINIWKERGGAINNNELNESMDSNGSNDSDYSNKGGKKNVGFYEGVDNPNNSILSGGKQRPTKTYTNKDIRSRTISGGEHNDRRGRSQMEDDGLDFGEDERQQNSSKTLSSEQLRYLRQSKSVEQNDVFEHNNSGMLPNNSPYHTYSPRPPAFNQPPSLLLPNQNFNKNNIGNSIHNINSYPPVKNSSPQPTPHRLPPLLNHQNQYTPSSPHPSFLVPNSHLINVNSMNHDTSPQPPHTRFIYDKNYNNNSMSHSGGMMPPPNSQMNITSVNQDPDVNVWDKTLFPEWEQNNNFIHQQHHQQQQQQQKQQQQQQQQIIQQQQQQQQQKQFREIDYDDLELGQLLGKGFFGEVKQGTWLGTEVAIKIIYRDQFKSKSSFEMFQNEVLILSTIQHPNIVQFLGACTTGSEDKHCIVIEWMGGGSLRQFLMKHFTLLELKPQLRLKIALDIAKGMNYLHCWNPPILHRDLSSQNILLDNQIYPDSTGGYNVVNDFKCKISDFGLSRLKLEQGQSMTASVGCIPYMAPEVFRGEQNSEKSDVYSYGMILWELLTSEEPQQDMKPQKMAHLAAHESYRPPIPLTTPQKWKQLLTMCWDGNPDKRPTFKVIMKHLNEMAQQGISSLAPIPITNFNTGDYA